MKTERVPSQTFLIFTEEEKLAYFRLAQLNLLTLRLFILNFQGGAINLS